MSEYETVIKELGGFGPAQVTVFILVSLFEAPASWGLLVHPVFASRKPQWTCNDNWNSSINDNPISESNYNDSVAADPYVKNCSLFHTSACTVKYADDFTSIVSEWDLICDKQSIPKYITMAQMIGGLLGAFICGQLADAFGRKKVLLGAYAIFIVSGLWSAFVNSWITYLVLKIIVGASMSGTMVVNFAMTMEFVTPKWRTFCGCVGFWNVGVMSLALLGYLIPNWRHLTMTCSLLGAPCLVFWWFIPESPRWLLLKGRHTEAEAILTAMAKRNKKPVPDFVTLHQFTEREREQRAEYSKYNYLDLCRNFTMTKTTMTILYMWFVCSTVYYGTTLGTGRLHGNIYLNLFLSGLVEIPGLIYVLVFNNRIGRRKTLCGLLTAGGLSCISVLFVNLYAKEDLQWLSTMFALIGKSGTAGAWAAALITSAELFPTLVRNIGMASSSIAGRIGTVIAPLLSDLDEFHPSIPYVIFGVLGVTCGLMCLVLPETLNKPLPDVLPNREYFKCILKKGSAEINGLLPQNKRCEDFEANGAVSQKDCSDCDKIDIVLSGDLPESNIPSEDIPESISHNV